MKFFDTYNAKTIEAICHEGLSGPFRLSMIYGASGLGKTVGLKLFAENNPRVIYSVMGVQKKEVGLLETLSGTSGSDQLTRVVSMCIEGGIRLIIVDDFQISEKSIDEVNGFISRLGRLQVNLVLSCTHNAPKLAISRACAGHITKRFMNRARFIGMQRPTKDEVRAICSSVQVTDFMSVYLATNDFHGISEILRSATKNAVI